MSCKYCFSLDQCISTLTLIYLLSLVVLCYFQISKQKHMKFFLLSHSVFFLSSSILKILIFTFCFPYQLVSSLDECPQRYYVGPQFCGNNGKYYPGSCKSESWGQILKTVRVKSQRKLYNQSLGLALVCDPVVSSDSNIFFHHNRPGAKTTKQPNVIFAS